MNGTSCSLNKILPMECVISLFSVQVQREDREEARINGGKGKQQTDEFGQRCRGKVQTGASEEREAQVARASKHLDQHRHVVTDPETKQQPSNCLTSQNRHIFAKLMICGVPCIPYYSSWRIHPPVHRLSLPLLNTHRRTDLTVRPLSV